MNNEHYKKELEQIKADEKWKEKIKTKMLLEVNAKEERKQKQGSSWNFAKYALGALCFCLLLSGVILYHHVDSFSEEAIIHAILDSKKINDIYDKAQKQVNNQLPILSLNDDDFASEGMGFEGYTLYHADQLIHNNPYDVNEHTKTLPVFQNINISGRFGMYETARYTSKEEKKLLTYYADLMGIKHYQIEENEYSRTLVSDICNIQMDSKDTIMIAFSEKKSKDNMLIDTENDTREEIIKRLKQVIKQPELKGLFAFDKVNIDIQMDYGYDEEKQTYVPSYSISISDDKGSQANRLVNNQLRSIVIYVDEQGYLSAILINLDKTMQKLYDYPIISLEEAKQRLIEGNYFTTSWWQGDIEQISYIEMIYQSNRRLDYFMPYYKFYMPLKDQTATITHDENILTYVAYYVPAIQSAYLEGMPTNIPFN